MDSQVKLKNGLSVSKKFMYDFLKNNYDLDKLHLGFRGGFKKWKKTSRGKLLAREGTESE